jgi:ABC-type multidrug transport system fused ATPase/permease subunit
MWMHHDAAIERAARLGGASELIAKLPEGFDTLLERPVRDLFSGLPDKTGRLQRYDYVDTSTDHILSGGQMQRLAVARMFMRSTSTEQGVGLLLFDEPSTSLDPTAEHGTIAPLHRFDP